MRLRKITYSIRARDTVTVDSSLFEEITDAANAMGIAFKNFTIMEKAEIRYRRKR